MFTLLTSLTAILGWGSSLFMGLSASSLLSAWVALELNLICFVLLMVFLTEEGVWVGMKYFLVQGVGSGVFIFSGLLLNWVSVSFITSVITMSLMLKMAMAPFQFWMLNIIKSVGWEELFFLMIIQKILPFFLLMEVGYTLFSAVAVMGAVIAVAGGASVSEIKSLLVYSSILSLSWMIGSGHLYLSYFFLGSYGLSLLLLSLWFEGGARSSTPSMGLLSEGRVSVTLMALSFFNMAGLPPTVGFFVKIAILAPLMAVSGLGASGLLLAGSAVFVYLYLRFIINSTVWETHSPVWASSARASVVLLLLLGASGAALCLYI